MEELSEKIKRFLTLGSGDGSGSGYGYGSGDGSGYGYGSGIISYGGTPVFLIDNTETMIYRVSGNVARGAILNGDLTLTTCYIVRDDAHFAHGQTLKEAADALLEKQFDYMDEGDRIDAFLDAFPDPDEIVPNSELYDWHHRLTGSCTMGRDAFVKAHGIDMGGKTSVREFCRIVKDSYGGSIIRAVMERIGET